MPDWIKHVLHESKACGEFNPKPTIKPEIGSFKELYRPRQEVAIDYMDMVTPVRGYMYLLVLTDPLTAWPEGFSRKNAIR